MNPIICRRTRPITSKILSNSDHWLSRPKPFSRRCLAIEAYDGTLPLKGYRVLDMTRVLAGVNRNKKSVGLSFQDPAGVEILHKLAADSDILVENYLPGSLKKYGMDYETIHEINPRLIYASITGFGQTGPYSGRAGYDVMVEAELGLMHITGSRDGPPVKVGVAVTDLTTGLYTSNSIMAALLARARTGKGQHLDVALSDCQVATLANIASSCLISGEKDEGRWGTSHPSIVPYRSYKTKDGDILFGGGNDRLFGILCDGLGRPEWKTDPKFIVNAQRVANRVELDSSIESITQQKTTQEWLEIFEGSRLPYAAVNDVQTTLNHSHVLARDMVKEINHEFCGPIKMVNTPVKYSESKPGIRTPPPVLGQHTDEVLKDIVGLNDSEIEKLKLKGAKISLALQAKIGKIRNRYNMDPTPTAPKSGETADSLMNESPPKYVPQFSAATEMILKRINSGASSANLSSIGINGSHPGYEDMRRSVLQGMKTTLNMEIPTPINASAGKKSTKRNSSSGTGAKTTGTPRSGSGSRGKGASRSKSTKAGTKRKRLKDESDSGDESTSISTLGDDSDGEDARSVTNMPTTTLSGRHVVKPTQFNPAAQEGPVRKRGPTKRTQEQALCKRCARGHSPQNNMIVFCDGCNLGWHQMCHDPYIPDDMIEDETQAWFCADCSKKKGKTLGLDTSKLVGWPSKTSEQKKAHLTSLSKTQLVALLLHSTTLYPNLPIFPPTSSPQPKGSQSQPTAKGTLSVQPQAQASQSSTSGLFPRAEANPNATINFIRKIPGSSPFPSLASALYASSQASQHSTSAPPNLAPQAGDQDGSRESTPASPPYPKPGHGLMARLPPDDEDLEWLVDSNDFEAFSHVVYDSNGDKIEENGVLIDAQTSNV
ncbi:CoA-transferase family III domain-containing protein [Xylogone sp. PMI_703]|nr:CoA-transferase family III domain-containing protein [Xylogone sp. PMI_703]